MKRQKNIEGKIEEQLKVLKDQSEKHPIISTVKSPNFNNVSFRNLLDAKLMKVFNKIRDQDGIIDYSRFNFIGSSKKYTFNFKNFMSLENLAENIYNGNVSLDAAKQEQRRMENMLENLLITIWLTMCIKFKKIIFSQTQNNFTKEEKKFSLLLKKIYFHCLDHMFLVKMCGKKKIQVRKNLCQQIQRKVF